MMFLAEVSDLKSCIPCAKKFHGIYDPDVPFSESAFLSYWTRILDNNCGFMVLFEHKDGDIIGGVGGVVVNFQTSDELNSIELFFWVEQGFRGSIGIKLLREFEKESARRGAKRIVMACMESSDPDRAERLYISRGYKRFERHFVKDVV